MFPFDVLKRLLDSGLSLPWMNRERAEEIVADYRDAGEAKVGELLQAEVDDLLERARESRERLVEQIRTEVTRQLGAMGVATKADLAELEQRLGASPVARKAAPAKKAPAKKAARKAAPTKTAAPAKKAPARTGAPATKAPATKAPVTKAPATKAAAGKAVPARAAAMAAPASAAGSGA